MYKSAKCLAIGHSPLHAYKVENFTVNRKRVFDNERELRRKEAFSNRFGALIGILDDDVNVE